jgi:conjugal transfer pilus assembly protein TraB
MTTPRQWMQTLRGLPQQLLQHLSPRQRQYAMLGALLAGGVGLLWSIFAFTASSPPASSTQPAAGPASSVTNIGVMSPGAQVNPVDQWVGTAGRKLAQYENEREEQGRLNKDRQTFEAKTMQRFAELEQRLTSTQQAAATPLPPAPVPTMPPAASLPPAPPPSKGLPTGAMPSGTPGDLLAPSPLMAPTPAITRITVAERSLLANPGEKAERAIRSWITSIHPEPYPPSCPSVLPVARCWAAWMRRPAGNRNPTRTQS